MKKITLFAILMLTVSTVIISCSGRNAEKEREDSIRRADSIAAVEAANEEALRLAEQNRQDSISQDSIQNAENFTQAVKALENISSASDIDKYLKNLGFTGATKSSKKSQYDPLIEEDREIDVTKANYTFTSGDKTINYQSETEESLSGGSSTEKITVEGDSEALDNLYKALKVKVEGEITKKGNTITIVKGWA